MGLFNFFSKDSEADKAARLLQPHDHTVHYLLTASNEFVMGKENPPLVITTESNIVLRQTVHENNIQTDITVESVTGKTEAPALQMQLQQMLALAEISKCLVIERDAHGKMKHIANMEDVHEQWQEWKQTKMTGVFPLENDQIKFAANFEKGLQRMDVSIQNNLNYFILIPDIYHVKKYNSPSNAGAEIVLNSRLVADMPVRCRFVPVGIEEKVGRAFLKLNAELLNAYEMQKSLKPYYKQQKEFSITDYSFTIDLDYELDSTNGQIIAGNLFLQEKMHNHLYYILHIQVMQAKEEQPVTEEAIGIRKPKRNFLVDEITDEQE